jgi:hypothetical protein
VFLHCSLLGEPGTGVRRKRKKMGNRVTDSELKLNNRQIKS